VAQRELGFAKIQNNPVYCHATRGKFDRMFIFGLQNLAATLCRFACDMVMFTQQEFGFFSLPSSFTTGSSFMPNKKNYDLFELARASRAAIDGAGAEAGLYGFNMISGYHRDLQRTKETLTKAVDETFGLVGVLTIAAENIEINRERIRAAVTPEMHMTAKAMALAMKGMPFRDAYRRVKESSPGQRS
jgi:argininosuccinate lyase